jgi:hypothetical protein
MEKFKKKLKTGNSRHAIIHMARTVGFEDANEANVEELSCKEELRIKIF